VIERAVGDGQADGDDARTVTVSGIGPRWAAADLEPLRG
jgi:tRNA threonylcarbamoyladenosine biosynthesis protein TsaE